MFGWLSNLNKRRLEKLAENRVLLLTPSLVAGEELLAHAAGKIDGMASGAIGVTNKRVMVIGFMGGQGDILLKSIQGVTPKIWQREIELNCGSKTIKLELVEVNDLQAMVNAINSVRLAA